MPSSESERVKQRYARRDQNIEQNRYNLLNASVWQGVQERQRAIITLFNQIGFSRLDQLKMVEVGCGGGANLLEFLRMGFRPENLMGIELLEDRVAEANATLPPRMVKAGDANSAAIRAETQDIVYQSVVFSSLLDNSFQEELAARMWAWVKPGGGVLWYDFIYNNPKNPDVRGVSKARVHELFPSENIRMRRLTLAPPISRLVTQIHPALYRIFNVVPLLRTHILCWIPKK